MKNDIRMLPISEIKIGHRHRKDFGDLEGLAKSIESGLLQSIGVSPEMELIWGLRRLLACRDILGWRTIPARVVSFVSIAQGEFDENTLRKDFSPSERVAIIETLRGSATAVIDVRINVANAILIGSPPRRRRVGSGSVRTIITGQEPS
jgi:hypothetical protein